MDCEEYIDGNATDEIGCSRLIAMHHHPVIMNEVLRYTCDDLYNACSSGICIPQTSWCDRQSDCKEGSDEVQCPRDQPVEQSNVEYQSMTLVTKVCNFYNEMWHKISHG